MCSTPRARVFISCGQAKGTNEVEVAAAIATKLTELGFDPYVAVQEQTLRGLKENIFGQLERSEYFLFIDFARERLVSAEEHVCRGSLFSHQELAIAAFLDLDVIALQESGVKAEDGILRFLQTNAITFNDRSLVPERVMELVCERWRADWRKELVLERDPGQFVDARINAKEFGRFFHIRVRNLDSRRAASDCRVFLERLVHEDVGAEVPVETLEFKWSGSPLAAVTIGAGAFRSFDAIWFVYGQTDAPRFNVHTDSTQFIPQLQGYGTYLLTFLVVSGSAPSARGRFRLSYGPVLNDTHLDTAPPDVQPNRRLHPTAAVLTVRGRG